MKEGVIIGIMAVPSILVMMLYIVVALAFIAGLVMALA